jgi:protein involved in polysaccharide export with SLBB domain
MSIRAAALLFLGLAVSLAGCTTTLNRQGMMASMEPPRERALAASAGDPIKVSDVLQFRLPDGSTTDVTTTYQVAPDGTVQVGTSGKIQVAGKTLEEARQAVRQAVAASDAAGRAIEIQRSEFYLVTVAPDGVQKVSHVPLRGRTTVKDALTEGAQLSSKVIWVARPMPGQATKPNVLPVDWDGIASDTNSTTNYQLRPGDFLFVADEPAKGAGRVFNAVTALFAPVK